MIKRLLALTTLAVLLSGCFMVPMALIGPATGGFNTASILKSGLSTGTNFLVKKSTGKTIGEHALEAINKDVLQQTYMPVRKKRKASDIIPFAETFR